MDRVFLTGLALLITGGYCASSVATEKETNKLTIGQIAPAWGNLKGTDDQLHNMNDYVAAKILIVCFTSNSCPYSVDYEDRIIALQQKYLDAKQSVQVVAINSNLIPDDSLANMKKRAAGKKFNFPYLLDDTQNVARAYDAIYTPEFFVLNQQRELIYKGAMDDATRADQVTMDYVSLAVSAGLRNTLPETTTAGARGCAIRFKRSRR